MKIFIHHQPAEENRLTEEGKK